MMNNQFHKVDGKQIDLQKFADDYNSKMKSYMYKKQELEMKQKNQFEFQPKINELSKSLPQEQEVLTRLQKAGIKK